MQYKLQISFAITNLLLSMVYLSKDVKSDYKYGNYCEIFQFLNYTGESLRLQSGQQISNFNDVARNWNSRIETSFLSFKLPHVSYPTLCYLRGCTKVDFHGKCSTFRISKKKMKYYRISSVKCQCILIELPQLANIRRKSDGDAVATTTEVHLSVNIKDSRSSSNKNMKYEAFSPEVTTINTIDYDTTTFPSSIMMETQCDSSIGNQTEIYKDFNQIGKKIIGIGRNYKWRQIDLAEEVQVVQDPILFLKPTTSYLTEGNPIQLPPNLGEIYYELELGVVIAEGGRNIDEKDALNHVAGYVLALDMTAKQFLKESIKKGLPWEVSKGFDTACPVGTFIPKSCIPNPHHLRLEARVNEVTTQNETTSQMIHQIPSLISYISKYFTLEKHDLILTGTPDKFGTVKSGDTIEGFLYHESTRDEITKINFHVA